jgi:hypothetical protein
MLNLQHGNPLPKTGSRSGSVQGRRSGEIMGITEEEEEEEEVEEVTAEEFSRVAAGEEIVEETNPGAAESEGKGLLLPSLVGGK